MEWYVAKFNKTSEIKMRIKNKINNCNTCTHFYNLNPLILWSFWVYWYCSRSHWHFHFLWNFLLVLHECMAGGTWLHFVPPFSVRFSPSVRFCYTETMTWLHISPWVGRRKLKTQCHKLCTKYKKYWAIIKIIPFFYSFKFNQIKLSIKLVKSWTSCLSNICILKDSFSRTMISSPLVHFSNESRRCKEQSSSFRHGEEEGMLDWEISDNKC